MFCSQVLSLWRHSGSERWMVVDFTKVNVELVEVQVSIVKSWLMSM